MVTNSSLIKGGKTKPIKRSFIRIEGDMVIKAFEKQKANQKAPEDSLSFSSLFIAEPEILHYSGSSLENDIFPLLSEKGFLYSYLSSEGEIHIHSKDDVSLVRFDYIS